MKQKDMSATSLRLATPHDFSKVQSLYWDIIDTMKDSPYSPKWEKGIYPTDEALASFIAKEQMYLCECEEMIMGAMVVNSEGSHGYEQVPWKVDAIDAEVSVVHILAVHPSFQGHGVAKFLVQQAIRLSKQQTKKAIRLDVVTNNIPAQRLYESMGFVYCATIQLFYEDTGLMDFMLYEYLI